MTQSTTEYWREAVGQSADENGIVLTTEQINAIAADMESAHENYGMAFYSPPPSDRISVIESECAAKIKRIESERDEERENVRVALCRALRQHSDARLSVGEYGEVLRHDGRTERIQ